MLYVSWPGSSVFAGSVQVIPIFPKDATG